MPGKTYLYPMLWRPLLFASMRPQRNAGENAIRFPDGLPGLLGLQ